MGPGIYIICSILMLNNLSTDNLYIVPQNERIGAKLVADGQLDAEFFEKIRPFTISLSMCHRVS